MILLLIKSSTYSHVSKSTILSHIVIHLYPPSRAILVMCLECASRAESKDGRLLKFSNIDMTGGFIAKYANTGKSATPADRGFRRSRSGKSAYFFPLWVV